MTVFEKDIDCELIFYHGYNLLEGPVWDAKNRILYCVAIRDNLVIALGQEDKSIRTYDVGCAVGCVALLSDDSLLIAKKDGIFKLFTESGHMEFICQPLEDDRMRFNDGKLDPRGRFLVGGMGDIVRMEHRGALYSVERDGRFRRIIEHTTVANGLGFTKDGTTLFFIDTPTKKVMKYDYDLETGEPGNPRVAASLQGKGSPDGMFVLPDDTILVCEWGGGCVSHWDPVTAVMIERYELPVTNVSCCCLGGENLDELYVTTAKCKDRPEEPLAGGLFRIKIG